MWSRVDRPNDSLTEKRGFLPKDLHKKRLCQKNEDMIMQGRKACPTSMFSLFFLKIVLGCKPVTVYLQLNQIINRKEKTLRGFFFAREKNDPGVVIVINKMSIHKSNI